MQIMPAAGLAMVCMQNSMAPPCALPYDPDAYDMYLEIPARNRRIETPRSNE